MRTRCVARSLVAIGAVSATAMGQTAPLVAIGEGQPMSWTQAMQSGRLHGVDPEMDGTPQPAMDFYATQGNAAFVASHLTPDIMSADVAGEMHQSLVMQWNPLMMGEDLAVASWELDTLNLARVGGLDLRGGSVHFSLNAPPGVWDISFLLQDKNGLWCGWFQSMPMNNWHLEWIMFGQGNQGGWQKFGQAGFDLSNVTAIRLDEAGAMVTFPLPPPGAAQGFWDWNAFDSIIITPTPGTPVLLAAALLIGLRRRR